MSKDGYTLAETLVALAAIGLAMGGLTAAVRVISLNQAATARTLAADRGVRDADRALTDLVADQGPFATDDTAPLHGEADGFSFDCAAPSPCAAKLSSSVHGVDLTIKGRRGGGMTAALPGVRHAHFVYIGERGVSAVWPFVSKDPETLRAIVLVGDSLKGETTLATAPIWREQGAGCVFDPISGGCRKEPG
jgi:hypothetical protein